MNSSIEQTGNAIYQWIHDSFALRTPNSNYFPRDARHPDATVAKPDTYSAKNIAYNFGRQLFFGGSRIQHATVIRTNGEAVRQVMSSVGFGVGRFSLRNTLNPATNFPNAFHAELILGVKVASVGASIGRTFNSLEQIWNNAKLNNIPETARRVFSGLSSREGENVMITWFRRFQWSVTAPDKEVTRIVVGQRAELQLLGEIAGFGTSQAMNEVGETRVYQFAQEHLREAKRLARTTSLDAGLNFLREHYPHIEGHENFIRRGLHSPRFNLLGLGLELFTGTLVGTVLSDFIPAGHLQHSIQNSVNYVVGTLFRGGRHSLNLRKVSAACAEGIPLTLVHSLVSVGMRRVHHSLQERTGIRLPGVHIAEDFASIAVYDLLKVRSVRLFGSAPAALAIGSAALLGAGLALYLHAAERRRHV